MVCFEVPSDQTIFWIGKQDFIQHNFVVLSKIKKRI